MIPAILLLPLLLGLCPAPAAAARPAETGFQYTAGSDGVTVRTVRLSDEDAGAPFSYALYQTRLGQQDGSSVDEAALVFQWKRPLAAGAKVSLWAGGLQNDLRSFLPAAALYEQDLGHGRRWWAGTGREVISTVAANELGLHRNRLSAGHQWQTPDGATFTVAAHRWLYSDQNRETLEEVSYSRKLSRRFDLTAAYTRHHAQFTRDDVYWVPQQQQALSLTPRYAVPIGEGTVSLSWLQALWARNSEGGICYYMANADYRLGRHLALGYQYLRDGDYHASTYHLKHHFVW